jgi:IclR family transcriptional regulator, acetate operon repressor
MAPRVQSVGKAFEIIEALAEHGPMGLSALAKSAGLPLTTAHRLVGTLSELGYLRAVGGRDYALGPRLVYIGERAHQLLAQWAVPHLAALVDELGETANLAMLDGDRIVYVAQAPSRHQMRMFTEVGRRVLPHCTAVGKALLARLPAEDLAALVGRIGLPALTGHTITTASALDEALARVRELGYAVDDGEHEVGVRCVAVALADSHLPLAMSISGPAPRMTEDLVERAAPVLAASAAALARDLAPQAGQAGMPCGWQPARPATGASRVTGRWRWAQPEVRSRASAAGM